MPGRRERVDPETAELIEQRLQRLLAEHPPRRASQGATAPRAPAPPEPAETRPRGRGAAHRLREFTREHLGVLAALAVLALLSAGWVVLRARPVALATTPVAAGPVAPASASPGPGSRAASTAPTPTRATVVVHVLGAVRKPGLVTLPDRSRVQDAIDAAGGLRRNADPGQLNLAQPVVDGEQILVGTRGRPAGELRNGGAAGTPSSGAAGTGGTVDLNSATQEQLEALPGVGPVTAQKILAWRSEHGRFTRVEELQEVSGIGPKTFAEIAPHCRV